MYKYSSFYVLSVSKSRNLLFKADKKKQDKVRILMYDNICINIPQCVCSPCQNLDPFSVFVVRKERNPHR